MRRAFTLTELMVVIAVIAIMAGLGVATMNGATNLAREHRTGAQIKKIDMLIMERYEGYRTRSLAVKIPATVNGALTDSRTAAIIRINGLRDLMRMEMPDRVTDVTSGSHRCKPITSAAHCEQSEPHGLPIGRHNFRARNAST